MKNKIDYQDDIDGNNDYADYADYGQQVEGMIEREECQDGIVTTCGGGLYDDE